MLERLQKILSARGIASRRKAEEYIEQGLVTVNGIVAVIGQKADPEKDTIEVDGKVLADRAEMLYFLLYKPVGVETSNVERKKTSVNDREAGDKKPMTNDAPTVRDLLPAKLKGKIYPVGRLDKDSEGLLLLTNDGPLSFRLTHPKFDHEKEYDVTTYESVSDSSIAKLERGIMIDGAKTKPLIIKRLARNRLSIVLTEGRNRQIRRMLQKVGSTVTRLARTRIMTLSDPSLKSGALRPLSTKEKAQLLAAVGL